MATAAAAEVRVEVFLVVAAEAAEARAELGTGLVKVGSEVVEAAVEAVVEAAAEEAEDLGESSDTLLP